MFGAELSLSPFSSRQDLLEQCIYVSFTEHMLFKLFTLTFKMAGILSAFTHLQHFHFR